MTGIPANTYWAVAGRVLAGPHPEFVEGGLPRLLDVGVRRFVDLTARGESYESDLRELDPGARYVNRPIDDLGVPSEDEMREILRELRPAGGEVVYVHCRYGLGRTGTAVGCLAKPYTAKMLLSALAALEIHLAGKKVKRPPPGLTLYRQPDGALPR